MARPCSKQEEGEKYPPHLFQLPFSLALGILLAFPTGKSGTRTPGECRSPPRRGEYAGVDGCENKQTTAVPCSHTHALTTLTGRNQSSLHARGN